jgi:glycine C-acetyltransferase
MNSNSYLGMSLREEIIQEEEKVAKKYGVGPGAVRFISGTFQSHRELEKKLAAFHQREDAMLFSSAYSSSGNFNPSYNF